MTLILIVADNRDTHARCVAHELTARGRDVVIFDPQELGNGAFLDLSVGTTLPSTLRTAQGVTVCADDIDSVWYRRPRSPKLPPRVVRNDDREFAKREWSGAFEGFLSSLNARFINPIHAHLTAIKPRQLVLAQAIGLTIPATLISNDPASALRFVSDHRGEVIHKAMSPPQQQFLETKRWAPQDANVLPTLEVAPTMFQQLIDGPGDVRATVFGSRILAAFIATRAGQSQIDSRLDLNVAYQEHTLPREIEEKLLLLMRTLDLVFGTIDLKVADDGDHVFLEINPQGQFLYIEILTGLPLVSAMADLLAGP